MTNNNRDKDYLDKLKEVDGDVRQRLDREFGQLRAISVAVLIVVVMLVIGRWMFGS